MEDQIIHVTPQDFEKPLMPPVSEKPESRAWDEYLAYDNAYQYLCQKESDINVYCQKTKFDLIEVLFHIQDGYNGDSDGFGVEPDIYIRAFIDKAGKIVVPFSLPQGKSGKNISTLLTLGIYPTDENGKVIQCEYDSAKEWTQVPGYFVVSKNEKEGLLDSNLNLIIPIQYKFLYPNGPKIFGARLPNNLCGVLSTKNEIIIPFTYSYISYIEKGRYQGNFIAELNCKHGIIDQNNKEIVPFDYNSYSDLTNNIGLYD